MDMEYIVLILICDLRIPITQKERDFFSIESIQKKRVFFTIPSIQKSLFFTIPSIKKACYLFDPKYSNRAFFTIHIT